MIGEPEDLWLVASDAGYGFTVRLKESMGARGGQDAAATFRTARGAAAGARARR